MAPVSRRPGTRSHPSSTQEVEEEDMFPAINFEDDNREEEILTQLEDYGRVTVSYSGYDNDSEYRPQLDNPSAIMPDDDDDYALKEYMASQEQINNNDQEEFKHELENEFQLSLDDDASSVDENNEATPPAYAYTQGTYEAANVLATGFLAFNNNHNSNVATTSVVNNASPDDNNQVADDSAASSYTRPCPPLIGRDEGPNNTNNNNNNTSNAPTSGASNIAAELANQLRAHGFAGLSEAEQQHISNSKDEGKNSKKYNNTQENLEKRFMETLTKYGGTELMQSLGTEMLPNPHDVSEESPLDFKFYAIVGGKKNSDKHKIINDALVLCAMKWFNTTGKNKGKQHEPSTFAKYMDQLSYVFKEKGIEYTYSNDFNKKGQFHGILKKKWADIRKTNPKFGTAPNKARVEQALVRKFVSAIRDGTITPYTNPEHLCLCVIFILGFYCGLRGSKEHIDLSTEDIYIGEYQEEDGEDLVGLKWAGVRVPFSKVGQLNLKNTKIKEQNDVVLTFVEDPTHDCWDPFRVFCFYLSKCHPKATKFYGRIVKMGCNEAKLLAKEFGTDIWFAESGAGRPNYNLGPTKHRSLCVEIARLSGVDDFAKCTGHALRALCITHCIGSGLSAADVAAKVRHSAINSSKSYAEECNERKANRMACMNPSKTLGKKKAASSKLISKRPLPEDVANDAIVDVAKRPKVHKTQPMLPENRQRFLDLVDSPVTTPSSKAASLPVYAEDNNENESPDLELKRLQKQNEILKLKAENARLQQEIANNTAEPHHHHRHSYPFTHHRGHEFSGEDNGGYRNSYPPSSRRRSRSPSPRYNPRNHHSRRYPEDHGYQHDGDYSGYYGYQDYHHCGY